MDATRARELLSVLADGIDPLTGEVLPREHLCNQPEIIRALHEVLRVSPSTKQKSQPRNAGKPWTEMEEDKLMDEFDAGVKLSEIAQEHGRTKGAIESRLVALGTINKTYINRTRGDHFGNFSNDMVLR